jgi:hypothetical protein
VEFDKVGTLIKGTEHRDAIHVAIAPVVAGEVINPGEHVGFPVGDASAVFRESSEIEAIGVVDPYLRRAVEIGQRFFIFLYPGTVTSLRHQWTHPAFREPDEIPESEQYLRMFAARNDSSYEDILEGVFNGDGEREIPGEFWYHFRKVTGKDVPEDERPYFFRCYC